MSRKKLSEYIEVPNMGYKKQLEGEIGEATRFRKEVQSLDWVSFKAVYIGVQDERYVSHEFQNSPPLSVESTRVFCCSDIIIPGDTEPYKLHSDDVPCIISNIRKISTREDVLNITKRWGPLKRSIPHIQYSKSKGTSVRSGCDKLSDWYKLYKEINAILLLKESIDDNMPSRYLIRDDDNKKSRFYFQFDTVEDELKDYEISISKIIYNTFLLTDYPTDVISLSVQTIEPTTGKKIDHVVSEIQGKDISKINFDDDMFLATRAIATLLCDAKFNLDNKYGILSNNQIISYAAATDLYSFIWQIIEATILSNSPSSFGLRMRQCKFCKEWDFEGSEEKIIKKNPLYRARLLALHQGSEKRTMRQCRDTGEWYHDKCKRREDGRKGRSNKAFNEGRKLFLRHGARKNSVFDD